MWSRTFVRLAERHDVSPALGKMWKKYYKVDGLVTQHLSPFEQKIVSPLLKDLPVKFLKKARDFLFEAGPGLGAGILVWQWGEAKHKEIAYHHRT